MIEKSKTIMEQHSSAGDYSQKAYYDIINRFAAENSTRTSEETMELLAAYRANPGNRYLDRIREGDRLLADTLLP